MEVIHNITIDMVRKGVTPRVYAMQFDTNTRNVQVQMLSNGETWEPPQGAVISLSYRKPDGTKGFYNLLEENVSAVHVDGNLVTVTMAKQVLTVPGKVDAALIVHSGDLRIATFPFEIHVTADPSAGKTDSDDYFSPEASAKNAVLYVPQELTEEQKAQARENIGAAAPDESGNGGGSIAALTGWEIVQSSDAVTLNYTLEDGSEHTDVIGLDANGYPVSITHDGIAAPGTWREADV